MNTPQIPPSDSRHTAYAFGLLVAFTFTLTFTSAPAQTNTFPSSGNVRPKKGSNLTY